MNVSVTGTARSSYSAQIFLFGAELTKAVDGDPAVRKER